MKKLLLVAGLAAVALSTSGCTWTMVGAVSNEKKVYLYNDDVIYHCNAEGEKPVCTRVREAR